MKKILLLLFGCLVALPAICQTKIFRAEKVQEYKSTLDVIVRDGLVYKWTIPDFDTARYFQANDGKYEAIVTFRKVGTTTPTTPIKIDGQAATFTGTWRTGATTSPGWFAGTTAFSNAVGATASYEFTGTQIELWAESKPSHGSGVVSIDGGPETSVSFKSSATVLPALIYKSPVLPKAKHKIMLRVTTGFCLLDNFIITE